jgi:exodeoxyribonuclease VII small subunit
MKFEDCLKRLEEIVERLEKGDLSLEESLALFEEGMKLSNSCRGELDQAEGRIEVLLKQGSKLHAQAMEAGEEPVKRK